MKGECYEPARLSVFPKENFEGRKLAFKGRDEFVLQMIEGGISRDAFRVSLLPITLYSKWRKMLTPQVIQTFLFEKREDYDFFMRELADTRGLKINATELNDIGDVNRLMNQDQVSRFLYFDESNDETDEISLASSSRNSVSMHLLATCYTVREPSSPGWRTNTVSVVL